MALINSRKSQITNNLSILFKYTTTRLHINYHNIVILEANIHIIKGVRKANKKMKKKTKP